MFSNGKGCPFTWSASAYFVCPTSEQNDEIMIFVEYASQSFLNIRNQKLQGTGTIGPRGCISMGNSNNYQFKCIL